MKKIGLMGCGVVAQYGHLPAIVQTPGLQLHALYDPFEEPLHASRKQFGAPHAFTSAEEFFASGIEAVTITSPAPFHKDNVLLAAKAGLPVLCEKPLAIDRAEADEMIAAMSAAGAPLYAAFCYRFSPSALEIRRLVKVGAIGSVKSLRLIYNWGLHGKYTTDSTGNRILQGRRVGRMLEGGPLVDCGTHQIDLAMFWLGSPIVRYSGHGAWVDDYEAPDHVWLHMDHACGAHTVVEVSYTYHHTAKQAKSEFVYELIGTRGVIRYDRQAQTFTVENDEGTQSLPFHTEKSFEGLYAEWSLSLATGTSALLTSAEDGTIVTEIARVTTDQVIASRILPAVAVGV
ncbi:MAG: Gfo/Idh/MocA family protein [Candidatus Methylacidiphilales bacterium]